MMLVPPPLAGSLGWSWLHHVRSIGQIFLGIADNSVIPMPGSLDVFTIWLAATDPQFWFYYAIMAVVGALIGGWITYFLAREGGKEALEKKLKKNKAENIYRHFERWGVGAVAIPALLPPPFPTVPFLLAAGALQYPPKRFLGALALGRGVRFTVIAWLGSRYGNAITRFFQRYYEPTLFILIGVAILAGIFALIQYLRYRKHAKQSGAKTAKKVA